MRIFRKPRRQGGAGAAAADYQIIPTGVVPVRAQRSLDHGNAADIRLRCSMGCKDEVSMEPAYFNRYEQLKMRRDEQGILEVRLHTRCSGRARTNTWWTPSTTSAGMPTRA
jgi:hypothetical protein